MQKVGKENYMMGILLIAEKNAKSGEGKLCDGNNADSRENAKSGEGKLCQVRFQSFHQSVTSVWEVLNKLILSDDNKRHIFQCPKFFFGRNL